MTEHRPSPSDAAGTEGGPSAEPDPDEPGHDLEEDRQQLGREGLKNLPDPEAPGNSVLDENSWASVEPNEPG